MFNEPSKQLQSDPIRRQKEIEGVVQKFAREKAEYEESKSASGFFERLVQNISDEESNLQEDEILVVRYYNRAGQPIDVSRIGYSNPHLIILCSKDAQGIEHHILVHMELVELNVMRLKVKGEEPHREPFVFFVQE